MHGITPPTLARELRQAGFEEVSADVGSQRWFMVVVAKPEHDPCERATLLIGCPSE
jgi:hypothetical protein